MLSWLNPTASVNKGVGKGEKKFVPANAKRGSHQTPKKKAEAHTPRRKKVFLEVFILSYKPTIICNLGTIHLKGLSPFGLVLPTIICPNWL